MREITFDTETTGLEPKQGHRIIEIGCIELINRVRTGNSFHCYINPQRDIPMGAQNVHGITQEFLADKPIFKHVAADFLKFIGDAKLVIHNASFDMKFINFELEKASFPVLSDKNVVDTLAIAKTKFPGAKANLDALCQRFNINRAHRVKHGALLDAELLAEVYIELTGGIQGAMFAESKSGNDNIVKLQEKQPKKYIEPRQFPLAEEDLALHKEFITKKIKNALWEKAGF